MIGFIKGTLVLTSDNKYKPIEEIQKGDYVISYNEDTKAFIAQTVVEIFTHECTDVKLYTFDDNSILIGCADLKFLTEFGYKSLGIGDTVIGITNKKLISIDNADNAILYELNIETIDNYIVNDLVVHNLDSNTDETDITDTLAEETTETTSTGDTNDSSVGESSSDSTTDVNFTVSSIYKGLLSIKVGSNTVKLIYPKTYANLITETDQYKVFTAAEREKLKSIDSGSNKYTLPTASNTELGGIKTGFTSNDTTRLYGIKMSDGNAYVNVPWTDTTYSNATETVAGLMSNADKIKLNGIENNANNYALPNAASNTLGGIKTGYINTDKNYAVLVDGTGNAYVNVPWTDNNTTYTAGTGISLIDTQINNTGVLSVMSGTSASGNGTVIVNTGGTISYAKVYGLGSAAYMNNGNITPAAHDHDIEDLYVGSSKLADVYASKEYVMDEVTIQSISVNGAAKTITDKNVNIDVPTKISDLTDDTGFMTYEENVVNETVENITHFTTYSDLVNAYPYGSNLLCLVLTGNDDHDAGLYYYDNNIWNRTTVLDADLSALAALTNETK